MSLTFKLPHRLSFSPYTIFIPIFPFFPVLTLANPLVDDENPNDPHPLRPPPSPRHQLCTSYSSHSPSRPNRSIEDISYLQFPLRRFYSATSVTEFVICLFFSPFLPLSHGPLISTRESKGSAPFLRKIYFDMEFPIPLSLFSGFLYFNATPFQLEKESRTGSRRGLLPFFLGCSSTVSVPASSRNIPSSLVFPDSLRRLVCGPRGAQVDGPECSCFPLPVHPDIAAFLSTLSPASPYFSPAVLPRS